MKLKSYFIGFSFFSLFIFIFDFKEINGDWGLGIGDWGLGIGPIPNPQSPFLFLKLIFFHFLILIFFKK
jgi:hypothetical protein